MQGSFRESLKGEARLNTTLLSQALSYGQVEAKMTRSYGQVPPVTTVDAGATSRIWLSNSYCEYYKVIQANTREYRDSSIRIERLERPNG